MSHLLSISTAVPEHSTPQHKTARFMRNVASHTTGMDHDHPMLQKLQRFYDKSGIERRYSVLEDYTKDDPEAFEFYGKNWNLDPFPTTAQRMQQYKRHAVPLAVRAGRQALKDAGVSPQEVTHLIMTTCTGFFAPGPDVLVAKHLELRSSVQRLQIGFMGCYAGFNGMRQAAAILAYDPKAVVLQVCVELCTLHYQRDADLDSIVANCLFADGCAAAVWGGPERAQGAIAHLVDFGSEVDDDSLDDMKWDIGDHGFRMGLSPQVPKTIERELRGFVQSLSALGDVDLWAVHPGGRAILDAARDALELDESQLEVARGVLRDFGNMSSATIFFVLSRILSRATPDQRVMALGFGPGLTLEGALLRAC